MKKILSFFAVSAIFIFTEAQIISSSKWSDLFSYNNVLAVREDNGKLIAATENGVFFYTPSSGEVTKLSKANGLHEVKISAFDYDATTKIGLVGYKSGAMDVITPPPYQDMQRLYNRYYSLGYLETDINAKFALISLIGYLTFKLKQKKPDVTAYQVIRKIVEDSLPEDFIKGVAVVVEDFSYGCKSFPTFGINDKDIPNKIKEILSTYVPF